MANWRELLCKLSGHRLKFLQREHEGFRTFPPRVVTDYWCSRCHHIIRIFYYPDVLRTSVQTLKTTLNPAEYLFYHDLKDENENVEEKNESNQTA